MVSFRYEALDSNGAKVSGEIKANDLHAAESRLGERHLVPLYVVEAGSGTSKAAKPIASNGARPRKLKASIDEINDLLRSMQVMVKAGVPIVEALNTITEHASSPTMKVIANNLKTDMLEGLSFDQAMRKHPLVFPEIVCEMLAAADEGGQLGKALGGAISYMEQRAQTKKAVTGALVYPVMLLSICIGTFLMFLVFILPTFGKTFEGLQVKLPATTTFLLALGGFLQKNFGLVFLGTIAGVVGLKFLLKIPSVATKVNAGLYRAPIFGKVMQQMAMARTMQTMGSLTATNIPIIRAIQFSGKVSGYPKLRTAMEVVEDRVQNGDSVAEAMQKSKIFNPMTIQLVSVGEKSGQLADLLTTSAEQLHGVAERKLKAALSLLEPLLILFMGLVVGLLTLSILLPLFTLNQSIK